VLYLRAGEKYKRGRPDGLLLVANPYLNLSPAIAAWIIAISSLKFRRLNFINRLGQNALETEKY